MNNLLKALTAVLIVIAVLASMPCVVMAEDNALSLVTEMATDDIVTIVSEEITLPYFYTVTFHFEVNDFSALKAENAIFDLCDVDGNVLDTKSFALIRGLSSFNLVFDVTSGYEIGKKFLLRLKEGAKSISYNGAEGEAVTVETYCAEENGSPIYQTTFYGVLNPTINRELTIQLSGVGQVTYPYCFIGEDLFVSKDILKVLKINCEAKSNPDALYLTSETGTYNMQLYIDDIYACRGGVGYNLSVAPFRQDDTVYIPLYDVAVYFACNYAVTSEDAYIKNISLTPSAYEKLDSDASFVNSKNLKSQTNYLIWISKSDYKVHVYIGSNNHWRHAKSMLCTIGTNDTPTIEGEFEYCEYLSRWTYPDFYCGPVMRFYNGYAIHSTLIRYNGTPYDNRVGMKLSHGCVRVRPEDIAWLVNYVPLHTKILVTA